MKNVFLILSILFLLVSFSSPDIQKKIIRQNGYDIECYVFLKEITSFDDQKIYYWFRNSEVHHSVSKAGGLVLHEEFKKYYRSNQLAEAGLFKYGLKEGEWRSWYRNGDLKTYTEWWDGLKHGDFVAYDSLGNILTKGYYKRGNRHGEWIDYIKQDTLNYKRGTIQIEKPDSLQKPGFFKRLFSKRDSITPQGDTIHKPGFFKRLFTKKTKKEDLHQEKTKDTAQKKSFFKRLFGKKDAQIK